MNCGDNQIIFTFPKDTAAADASGITSFYEFPTFVGAQRMSSEENEDDDEDQVDMSVRVPFRGVVENENP